MQEELWQVCGNHPGPWKIPLYVHWEPRKREAYCFAGVPLLKIQEKEFNTLIGNHGARRVNGQWMITLPVLHEIGKRAEPGTDPETLLVWERPRLQNKREFRKLKDQERNDFLDALYHRDLGYSRDEIGEWWHVFCDHAFDWLINRERSIDMTFIKLHPMPFRADWLMRRIYKHSIAKGKINAHTQREDSWRGGGLLDVSGENTIRRGVEVEYSKFWWKTVKRVERIRLERLNPARYAEYVLESVRKATPIAKRLFKAWVARKDADSGVYVKGDRLRVMALERNIKSDHEYIPRWGTSDKYRQALFLINRPKFEELRRKYPPLPKTNVHLSDVPTLQPETEDVRDGRGNGGHPG